MTACIEPVGEGLRIRFNEWDQESYRLFLKTKTLPEHDIQYDELDAADGLSRGHLEPAGEA